MNIKGAIFDLDDTLIDTEPIYYDTANNMIKEYGNDKILDLETKIKILGSPEIVTAKKNHDTYNLKLTLEEFIIKRNAVTSELFKKCPFIEGEKEITYKFKHELNFKTALATSSTKIN